MSTPPNYNIQTDIRFGALQLIDIDRLQRAAPPPWFNQTLCAVNDCVVRLGVVQGEFHWHTHAAEDEFFYVVSGRLLIDLADRTVELAPQQGFVVPHGSRHRTRAPERTVMLMFEGRGVQPVGDAP